MTLASLFSLSRSQRVRNFIVLSVILIFLSGCGLAPREVSLSDPEIKPFLRAMSDVDRQALGFTPVETNSTVRLETGSRAAYDAMLHIYGETSRTVAFRKTSTGYRWIAEQEIHTGPGWEQTVDGTFRERIVVEFQTERVNGIPTNQICVSYSGNNSNLVHRQNLTIEEIRPILLAWKTAAVEPQPPDLPGAGFDPAPAMFVLMMLVMLLAAALMAILVTLGLLALTTALGTMGIISIAVFTGAVKRSVTAGFKALILASGTTGGLLLGVVGAWGLTLWGWSRASTLQQLGIGAITGLLVGFGAAYCVNLAWTRVAAWVVSNVPRKAKPDEPDSE